MPRFAYSSGNEIFIPAMKITNKMESDCQLVKITMKN
jgi:hypothetical protein